MFEKHDTFVNGQLYAVILRPMDILCSNQVYTRVELNQLSMSIQRKFQKNHF